jgi:predicted ATPase
MSLENRTKRNPCAKLLKLWHITKQIILNKVVLANYSLYFNRKCLILHAKFSIMIDSIRIQNYKSIVDLTLELGRFNVIIGTNGCGKSNILEAIAMGALSTSDNVDIGRLSSYGIRVTEPDLMVNAFEDTDDNMNEFIQLEVSGDNRPYSTMIALSHEEKRNIWMDIKPKEYNIIKQHYNNTQDESIREVIPYDEYHKLRKELIEKPTFKSFLTYSPNENTMREMVRTISVYPFGVHGEGLFQYLKLAKTQNLFPVINKGLRMLDWFEEVFPAEGLLSNEFDVTIKDKYMKEALNIFDQRSTNEGFLYLLFYLTLFNSQDTPPFFAIDNIETSFNPGLCQSLIRYLTGASKENGKQVILTTHNPYILDGLDLSDDEQRLFVCRRDIDGHTRIERVKYREDRKMSLSELWMSGLIGALPDNF